MSAPARTIRPAPADGDYDIPGNELAETAVLAACLRTPAVAERVAAELRLVDFTDHRRAAVFEQIVAAVEAERPVDPAAISVALAGNRLAPARALVLDLVTSDLAPVGDIAYHVQLIRTATTRRAIAEVGTTLRIVAGRSDPDDLPAALDAAYSALDEAAARTGGDSAGHGSWDPVDITPVLDGRWQPPTPTIGRRSDGRRLFYPGKMHAIISETEAGKTWLSLSASRDTIEDDGVVIYLDFEDDEGGVVGRLLAIGATPDDIQARFVYLRPTEPVNSAAVHALLKTYRPALVIIDGVTEAMSLNGLDPLNNADIAKFNALLARPAALSGAAVVALDHVTKDVETRGRYAIGGVHKVNALDGAAYILENRRPFGIGMDGVSSLKISKDRPGQLRVNGLNSSGGLTWYADLKVGSRGEGMVDVVIEAPHERAEDFRPTVLMERIAQVINDRGPMSKKRLELAVKGRAESIRQAVDYLILDGFLSEKNPHELLRPYPPKESE